MSVVSVVCCQVEVCVSGLSLVQRSPADCGASECERDASKTRRLWPAGGRGAVGTSSAFCHVEDEELYEGWNFNSGNYLFTTDTK